MTLQIRKAERRKAKLRLALVAPSGAGKTYSALQLAFGMGGKVGMIDTENGSGDLYANLGDYDIITLQEPYTVKKYLDALKAFEQADYNTVIIDSLSHAWAGAGGLLDKQGKIADASRSGNSYTAWRTITPEHNALVEAILQSPAHIIATMRAKTEYVQEKGDNGKTVVRKVGLAPIQRDGLEYEFTVVMDIDASNVATASKDRTTLFSGEYFKITSSTGTKLLEWLEQGVEPPPIAKNMPDDEYRDHELLITEALSLPDLQASFGKAVDAAKSYNDLAAVNSLIRLKDIRKSELQILANQPETMEKD